MKNKDEIIRFIVKEAVSKSLLDIERNYRIVPIRKTILNEERTLIQQRSSEAFRAAFRAAVCGAFSSAIPGVNVATGTLKTLASLGETIFTFKASTGYFELAKNYPEDSRGEDYYTFVGWIYRVIAVLSGIFTAGGAISTFTDPLMKTVEIIRGGNSRAVISAIARNASAIFRATKKFELIFEKSENLVKQLDKLSPNNSQITFLRNLKTEMTEGRIAIDEFVTELERLKNLDVVKNNNLIESIDSIISLTKLSDDLEAIIEMSDADFQVIKDLFRFISNDNAGMHDVMLTQKATAAKELENIDVASAKESFEETVRDLIPGGDDVISDIWDTISPDAIDTSLSQSQAMSQAAANQSAEAMTWREWFGNLFSKSAESKGFLTSLKNLASYVMDTSDSAYAYVKSSQNILFKNLNEFLRGGTGSGFSALKSAIVGKEFGISIGGAAPVAYEIVDYFPGGFVTFKITDSGVSDVARRLDEFFNDTFKEKLKYSLEAPSSGKANIHNDIETIIEEIKTATTMDGIISVLKKIKSLRDSQASIRSKSLLDLKTKYSGLYKVDRNFISIDSEALKKTLPPKGDALAAKTEALEGLATTINETYKNINVLFAIEGFIRTRLTITIHEIAVPPVFATIKGEIDNIIKSTKGTVKDGAREYRAFHNAISSTVLQGSNVAIKPWEKWFRNFWRARHPGLLGFANGFDFMNIPDEFVYFNLGFFKAGNVSVMLQSDEQVRDDVTVQTVGSTINIDGSGLYLFDPDLVPAEEVEVEDTGEPTGDTDTYDTGTYDTGTYDTDDTDQ